MNNQICNELLWVMSLSKRDQIDVNQVDQYWLIGVNTTWKFVYYH